jgi:phosphoglycolate phosphatase-like HAD superfamily hydrolase
MDFFETVITGQDVERRKPDPEGLLKAALALKLKPSEVMYVGDTAVDVQASRAAEMTSVAVLSGAGDSALLSAEGPDRIIYDCARLLEVLI